MSSEKDGIVVVLSSPSGAGKTTLVKKIAQENNLSETGFVVPAKNNNKYDKWKSIMKCMKHPMIL